MIRLMEVQYNDYHDDEYELEQGNYYPLYDYVAGMYYRVRVTDGMSEAEKDAVVEEQPGKVLFER